MEKLDFIFKKERDFGALISDYINLFKLIFKHFNKSILVITLPFMAIVMVVAFFMVNYFSELFQNDMDGSGIAVIIQIVLVSLLGGLFLLFAGMLISTFGIEYLFLLEERRGTSFDSKDVIANIKSHFSKYISFFFGSILIGLILALPIGVVAMILAFIPLIGQLALGVLMAMVMLFMYCSLFLYLKNDEKLFNCFRASYQLIKKKIFIYGMASYVMQFMVQIVLGLIFMIPGFVLVLSALFIVGFRSDFFSTFGGKFIVAIGAGLMAIFIVFSTIYLIGFFVLQYFSLLESTHGEQTIEDIEAIGEIGEETTVTE